VRRGVEEHDVMVIEAFHELCHAGTRTWSATALGPVTIESELIAHGYGLRLTSAINQ